MTVLPDHLPTDPDERAELLARIDADRTAGRRLNARERLQRQGLIFNHAGRSGKMVTNPQSRPLTDNLERFRSDKCKTP